MGLSGFAGSLSSFTLASCSGDGSTATGCTFVSWVACIWGVPAPEVCADVWPEDSTAASGIGCAILLSSSLLCASSDTVSFKANASSSVLAVKLPLLISAVLSRFPSALPLPTPSSGASADILGGSTETKLARILDVGLLLFDASLERPLVERPRASGELSLPLFSNMDRRLRTAEEERSVDIAVSPNALLAVDPYSTSSNEQ